MSAKLTPDQIGLIENYASYSEDDLFSLVGNLAVESVDPTAQGYVMGLPDVLERGRTIVMDVGGKMAKQVCDGNRKVGAMAKDCEPVEWVANLLDLGLDKYTSNIPVLSIAIGLGKLCQFSLGKFCDRFVGPA